MQSVELHSLTTDASMPLAFSAQLFESLKKWTSVTKCSFDRGVTAPRPKDTAEAILAEATGHSKGYSRDVLSKLAMT